MQAYDFITLISQRWRPLIGEGLFLFPIAVGFGSTFTHCAGMCGPIHFFLASQGGYGRSVWLYHAGRITTYIVLGGLAAFLGGTLTALSTDGFRIGAGIALALIYATFGLGLLGWKPGWLDLEKRLGILFPARLFARLFAGGKNPRVLYPAGLAAGLLPCPSTHAVLLWALGLGRVWQGAAGMGLLGIATLPVFAVLPHRLVPANWNRKAYQAILGTVFLGLSAWRIYGLATRGPSACH